MSGSKQDIRGRAQALRAQSVEEEARKKEQKDDKDLGVKFEMFRLVKDNAIANGVKMDAVAIAKETLEALKEIGYGTD